MSTGLYRDSLRPCQIYTRLPRQNYIHGIRRPLHLLSSKNVLQIMHRPNANCPIYSPEYLKVFLSRFGEVEAVLQISHNLFMVIFKDEKTAQAVASDHRLGVPTGQLLAKMWDMKQNMGLFYRMVKMLEKRTDTANRFEYLMDQDDVRARTNMMRYLSRYVVSGTKGQGFNSQNFLCDPLSKPRHSKTGQSNSMQLDQELVRILNTRGE